MIWVNTEPQLGRYVLHNGKNEVAMITNEAGLCSNTGTGCVASRMRSASRARTGTLVLLGLALGMPGLLAAEGDPAAGRKLYENKCLSCHGDARVKGTLAPSLVAIIGRKAGAAGQGATSRAMSEAAFTWDEAKLRDYLAAPSEKVHGTIMPIGVARSQDRDDLIAYIKSMR